MDPIDALGLSWNDAASVVAGVRAEDLTRPTTCAGWDVRGLLNHTLGECQMMTLVNQGEQADNDRGDLVGDGTGLSETWARVGEENIASWRASGLDGSRTYFYGTFPAHASAVINLGEVLVHTWDLARGIDVDFDVDPEQAALVHGLYAAIPLDGMRKGGMLAAEVPVAADASIADRMLGLLGRQP
jgi:uncharacterized protein (TIGR03086 family)